MVNYSPRHSQMDTSSSVFQINSPFVSISSPWKLFTLQKVVKSLLDICNTNMCVGVFGITTTDTNIWFIYLSVLPPVFMLYEIFSKFPRLTS